VLKHTVKKLGVSAHEVLARSEGTRRLYGLWRILVSGWYLLAGALEWSQGAKRVRPGRPC